MWLLGWLVRVLLLLLAPLYFLFRFGAESLAWLDQWAWHVIQKSPPKKQAETSPTAVQGVEKKAS